jgi:cytochrome c oxidase assembly factor CtaG
MQWWCAAQGVPWEWTWQPYPGVWLFVLTIGGLYLWLSRPAREDPAGPGAAVNGRGGRRRLAALAGVLALWTGLDWPVGALGAGYLASVHMVQYLLIAIVAPALFLAGTPPSAFRRLAAGPSWVAGIERVTRPYLAALVFILVTIVTHLPQVVDLLKPSQVGSFLIDLSWLLAGLIFWWPILAPVPARAGFLPPLQVLYLFPVMLAHTAISVYLVFSRFPVYATYELSPPTGWVSALEDQQIAGGLMWVTATPIMWSVIAYVFFRWSRAEAADAETVGVRAVEPGSRGAAGGAVP